MFVYMVIGGVVGYFLAVAVMGGKNTEVKKEVTREEKILDFIDEKGRITNDELQALLGIADSTATKYLQELEDKGLIKQQGETGRSVYYEKVG